MKNRVLDGQQIKGSKFLFVMAAAKRSKQINRMAKERGLPPNQVSSIKTKGIKAPTIAITEILEGNIEYCINHQKKRSEDETESLSKESADEAEDFSLSANTV